MRIKKVSKTTQTGAQIIDGYSNSQVSGYSCNYINKMDRYSTSEIKTNKIWKDGRPIYRVVLTGTLPVGAGSNEFNLPNTSIKNVDGMVHSKWGSWHKLNSEYKAEAGYEVYMSLNSARNGFSVNCGSFYTTSSEYEIIVEYTKTTDTPVI